MSIQDPSVWHLAAITLFGFINIGAWLALVVATFVNLGPDDQPSQEGEGG